MCHRKVIFTKMAIYVLEVCRSDPNPIQSDSFGFRNKNLYFVSDRIGAVISQSDRFEFDVDYQLLNELNQSFINHSSQKEDISEG